MCVFVSLMHAVFFVTSARSTCAERSRSILIHLRLVASNPAHLRLFQQALIRALICNFLMLKSISLNSRKQQ
jgi:hypothetical protein